MTDPKRAFLRLDDYLECTFLYPYFDKEREGKGIILDISGGGFRMITKDVLRTGCEINASIYLPVGCLNVAGKVLSSKLDYYVTDRQKDIFWTSCVQFGDISITKRRKIIDYVYQCQQERRLAKLKKTRNTKQ